MTFIRDHSAVSSMDLPGLVRAIGWLDAAHPFSRGEVEPEFSRKLMSLLKKPIWGLSTIGIHYCSLCTAENKIGPDARTSQNILLVPAQDCVYEAPIWIGHYVEQHSYLPPIEYRHAVMDCPDAGSEELRTALLQKIPELLDFQLPPIDGESDAVFFGDWDVQKTLEPSPEHGDEKKWLEVVKRHIADARPAKTREQLIAEHGGHSRVTCIWAGCDCLAMRNIAFCFEHAYPEFENQVN